MISSVVGCFVDGAAVKVAGVVSAFMVRSEKRTKADFAKAESLKVQST